MIQPKHSEQPHSSSEAGYTILEGIMAIVVVTVLLVAISPMIGFAAAVRMQAKRTQLASQAARTYISFVKSEPLEDGQVTGDRAPGENNSLSKVDDGIEDLATFPAPDVGDGANCEIDQTSGYCDADQVLYCVDFDGDADTNPDQLGCQTDSPVDMFVQPIGRFAVDENGDFDYSKGYDLAVRVYQANAFRGDIDQLLYRVDEDDPNSSNQTQSYIGRRDLPLVQLSTSVPPEKGNQYSTFCADLGCD